MNVSQLVDRFFALTQRRYNDRYEAIDFMNDAVSQLADSARLKETFVIQTIEGQEEYSLPTDFKAPISLYEEDFIYPLVQSNEPWGYSLIGENLVIKPLPTESKELTLLYYKYPKTLVDEGDEPDIDPAWHYLLPIYAASIAMMTIDPSLGDRYSNQWEEGLRQFRSSMHRKNKATTVNQKVLW